MKAINYLIREIQKSKNLFVKPLLKKWNHKTSEILHSLLVMSAQNKKHYVIITIDSFLKFLHKRNIKISRRTLFYHLQYLEHKRYIIRKRRIYRDLKTFKLKTEPTVYILTHKAVKKLEGLAKLIGQCTYHIRTLFNLEKIRIFKLKNLLRKELSIYKEMSFPKRILFELELEDAIIKSMKGDKL